MTILHEHLIRETPNSFTRTTASEAAPAVANRSIVVTHDHTLVQSVDTRVNGGVERVRQRQCKGLVTLCNTMRNYEQNEGLTCGQIWHITWRNGEFAPKAGNVRDRGVGISNDSK
ncbi:Leucine-rich repeat-containing protein 72 [Phytophthora nicotianae]|uniref:Leucine-rich repeat-containing protein 72 n=1 Tax=Phytophthora nicotianae TaxID=4792 RepID=A0A0W8D3P2_PHYNI|nr:Leucine-rich repeat-containing protein 72 [Phytophthora nicotianae]